MSRAVRVLTAYTATGTKPAQRPKTGRTIRGSEDV
jgi:hypothetical protein